MRLQTSKTTVCIASVLTKKSASYTIFLQHKKLRRLAIIHLQLPIAFMNKQQRSIAKEKLRFTSHPLAFAPMPVNRDLVSIVVVNNKDL